jgi:hypothetical protein
MPKIFRMTSGGKLSAGIFEGETINTPSMLCVEDYLVALKWAKSLGGLTALRARADANAAVLDGWISASTFAKNLSKQRETQSNTSVCFSLAGDESVPKKMAKLLETEGVAYDIGGYRDAPPGLRIWCGATVEARSQGAAAVARLGLCNGCGIIHFIRGSHMAPRVLVSDKLSETAVQIFRDRGIDVDYQPDLGKDKDALLAAIPPYDGLAIRSATKVTPKILEAAKNLKVSAGRHRGGQRGYSGSFGARHRRDEYALWKRGDHGGACTFHDDGAGPANSRSQCLHSCRQVGEEPLHGG